MWFFRKLKGILRLFLSVASLVLYRLIEHADEDVRNGYIAHVLPLISVFFVIIHELFGIFDG